MTSHRNSEVIPKPLRRIYGEEEENRVLRDCARRWRTTVYDTETQCYDFADPIGPNLGLNVADRAAPISFVANPAVMGYAPNSEAEARTLEHAISTNALGRQNQYTVYGKLVSAALNGGVLPLTLVPTRVVIENYL